jgi:NAD(P)-dependent dehydrogenase (short-subunit alcohol dehydrogenase family)
MRAEEMNAELNGRTYVVTGSTSGIGREVALYLADRGGKVLGVGRDAGRCREAQREIRARTDNSDVTFLTADLSSQSEIRTVAKDILQLCSTIDVLVNNAGLFTLTRKETLDGLETQLAVNWLAAYMLTGLLMPRLLKAPCPRVVTVSSGSHFAGTMHWDDVGLKRGYQGLKAYDQSKLAGVLFSSELSRRLRTAPRLSTYAVDPGLVKTQIAAKGTNGLVRLVWKIRTRNGISAEQAAESVAWCAVNAAAAGKTGLYWKERKSLPSSPESCDPEAAGRLWELGERLCGIRYP